MDATVGIVHLMTDLEEINKAAFSSNETLMYALINQFNDKYRAAGFLALRDETHQCYTAGLLKYVSSLEE